MKVETFTPGGVMQPIGPYSHIAKAGSHLWLSAIAGVDPETGDLAGPDIASQTRQILKAFRHLLEGAGSDLEHVVHVQVFLKDMADFEEMNRAYAEELGAHRPARTVVAVSDLPKPGARLTMSLQAVVRGEVLLSSEDEAELCEAIAEADRGETISVEELLTRLDRPR